jgi:hypothetical protein
MYVWLVKNFLKLKPAIMKKIIFFAFTAIVFAIGCGKDEPAAPPSLVGKWGIVNVLDKEVVNGTTVYQDNYTGQAADYMEFKNDNSVSYFISGFGLTLTYKLLPNNKVEISGDTLTIQNLSANSATLVEKYAYGTNTYDETTYNLKR